MSERFCRHCGSPLPEGSEFCTKCGKAVSAAQAPPEYAPALKRAKGENGEKGEKTEKGEKETEKHEEKEREGSAFGAFFGGGVLIWLGVTFYLAVNSLIPWSKWWSYFISGMGILLILLGLFHSARRQSIFPFIGLVAGGAVLSLMGFSGIYTLGFELWPLMIILLGIVVILMGTLGRRRIPKP
ncbi:MAG: zinc ribbon domain-containing protein [Candidatus Verstraetearchaeota archaeon]|nr:zinc ribbon domain-containing protein [Candidatus Verstraetearchaeota archaeon]